MEKLPDTKIIICEPLYSREKYKPIIKKYAAEARKIAEEFNLPFVALQEKLDEAVEIYGFENCYHDGLHPNLVASKIISDEWLRVFKEQVAKE